MERVFKIKEPFKTKDSKKISFIFIYRVGNAYLDYEKYMFQYSTCQHLRIYCKDLILVIQNLTARRSFSIDLKELATINERFQNFNLSIF